MRVSIVNGICVRHDAISESVLGTQRAIDEAFGPVSTIYCYSCDVDAARYRLVSGLPDLLFDREFMSSDVIIYHFGIFYELFNSIFFSSRAKKVVVYHNVTPIHLLPTDQRPLLEKAIRQKANMAAADAIWAVSEVNREDLIDYGLPAEKITVEPLYLKAGLSGGRRRVRDPGPVELLFVGRIVRSKGVEDLIEAVAAVRRQGAPPFRLRLAGNLEFSDQALLAGVRRLVTERGLEDLVVFEGQVSDGRLGELYRQADIFVLPSYHEGFCVPLIEALDARCVPLTYDAGNLPHLLGPCGVTVPTGDRSAFAAALTDLVAQFSAGRPTMLKLGGRTIPWDEYDARLGDYLQQFSFEAFKLRTLEGLRRLTPARDPDSSEPALDGAAEQAEIV